jgi:hypothetical protein
MDCAVIPRFPAAVIRRLSGRKLPVTQHSKAADHAAVQD